MSIALSLLIGVVVVLAITAMTGYFVAQEFAFMAVDRSRMGAAADKGDAAAKRVLGVTRRTSFMLSGAQLGITITTLVVGYVAEPLIGRALGELLGLASVPQGVGVAVGTVLALLFSTVVQMIFGELVPKNLAIARPEPVARWLARSTTIYLAVFGWLISLFDKAAAGLLRAVGIEPVEDKEHSATARDLEHSPELSRLLDRMLDFPGQPAEHAMVPRSRTDVVRGEDTVADVLSKMATGHTRYPVVGTDSDDVIGVVDMHDLLSVCDGQDTSLLSVSGLMRAPIIVPTSLPLPEVANRLAAEHAEMAVVVDEYGGFAGVVTMEDMAEEIVGEINDEHDSLAEAGIPVSVGDGWLFSGDTHLDEVERLLDITLPDTDAETLGGLVIETSGDLPDVGDRVDVDLPDTDVFEELSRSRILHTEVRQIERRVPSRLYVAVEEATR